MTVRRELVDGISPDQLPHEVVTSLMEHGRPPQTPESVETDGRVTQVSTNHHSRRLPTTGVSPRPIRVALVPVTVRLPQRVADALKRASLERQLAGEFPNTQQEIVEHVLEPWLRQSGFLPHT